MGKRTLQELLVAGRVEPTSPQSHKGIICAILNSLILYKSHSVCIERKKNREIEIRFFSPDGSKIIEKYTFDDDFNKFSCCFMDLFKLPYISTNRDGREGFVQLKDKRYIFTIIFKERGEEHAHISIFPRACAFNIVLR